MPTLPQPALRIARQSRCRQPLSLLSLLNEALFIPNPERGLLLPGTFGENAHSANVKRPTVLKSSYFPPNYSYIDLVCLFHGKDEQVGR